MNLRNFSTLGALVCCAPACGDSGADTGNDMNPPQESVSDGTFDLSANVEVAVLAGVGVLGLAPDTDIADGWTVHYDRFLVTLGTFEFTDADGTRHAHQEDAVVDLLQLVDEAFVASVPVPAGPLIVRYSLPNANSRFSSFAATAPEDRERMVAGGWSIYVEGAIEKPDGRTCTDREIPLCTPAPRVEFRWGFAAGTLFDDCPDIAPGTGDTLAVTLTLPGDRWFLTDFDSLSVGAPPPTRRAQWLADADLDRDGEATLAELDEIRATDAFDRADGYDLSGAPIPVATVRDFVEAQVRAIGRDALGPCPTSIPL